MSERVSAPQCVDRGKGRNASKVQNIRLGREDDALSCERRILQRKNMFQRSDRKSIIMSDLIQVGQWTARNLPILYKEQDEIRTTRLMKGELASKAPHGATGCRSWFSCLGGGCGGRVAESAEPGAAPHAGLGVGEGAHRLGDAPTGAAGVVNTVRF